MYHTQGKEVRYCCDKRVDRTVEVGPGPQWLGRVAQLLPREALAQSYLGPSQVDSKLPLGCHRLWKLQEMSSLTGAGSRKNGLDSEHM